MSLVWEIGDPITMASPNPKSRHLLILLLLPLFIFTLYSLSHFPTNPNPNPIPNPTQTHFSSLPQKFKFTLKILSFDRLPSLSRCLNSLSAARYDGDTVNLHIFIDHFPIEPDLGSGSGSKLENSRRILDYVDGFKWVYGEKLVHYRTTNVGLQAQWIEAWWPNSDHEFVFVVEDDVEVSPLFYRFLKRFIFFYYYNQSNFRPWIYGASLQRPRFVPGKHGNKMKLDTETRLFLYPLVGTWGQLLFPKPWKEFRLWYDDHKAKGIKPYLEGMVTNGWYKKMGERIWTPWFIKFIHSRGYFNFYTNFPHKRALSVSHRDAGVNYGKTAGPDSQLLDENSVDISHLDLQPLSNLQWYDFCFKQVLPHRVAKKFNEIGHILQSLGKHKPVFLISLSKASDVIIRNLICHFEKFDIQNYIFMVPKSNLDLLVDLGRRGHPAIDTEDVFDSIMMSRKPSEKIIKEMVVKAYVIQKCLESGFESWVIDRNMLLLSNNPLVDSLDSKYDFYAGKDSGFFIARSTSLSRKIWDETFARKFAGTLESLVSQDSPSGENGKFVDAIAKFSERYSLKLKFVEEFDYSLKLENIRANESLPENTKMVSWSAQMELDSLQKHLRDAGMWIIDGGKSCKAVICHES